MPRRVASPVATQDEIEADQEPGSSQHDSVRDPDHHMGSDEEAPQPKPTARSKRVNGTKKSKAKTGKVKSEKNTQSSARRDTRESDEEQDHVQFDRDEFLATARPISKVDAAKVGGLAGDWKELRHQVQTAGYPLVTDTAVAVAEISGNDEEGQKTIDELDAIMRKLIDAEKELTAHAQSLEALQARTASGEIIESLEDAYMIHERDLMEVYGGLTSRQKFAKHNDYIKFRDRVWEVNHEDAMPPINDLIPREDADSDAESEIEIGGVTQDYKCPLTLTNLKNPLTSRLCGHSFSADAIKEYLKTARGGRKACPSSGCSSLLSLADLEPNKELAERAAAAARRAKRREEESESEGDIVD